MVAKRWMRYGWSVKASKVVTFEKSLALVFALVQAFAEYQTLKKYLEDVNHFIHLVSLLNEVKSSKFNRTKQLITCGMGLLVFCASIGEAEKIFETTFIFILSKYGGQIFESDKEHTESLIYI
ncbi:hypothetical protein QTP88_023101 [Uroleucon formosanum]